MDVTQEITSLLTEAHPSWRVHDTGRQKVGHLEDAAIALWTHLSAHLTTYVHGMQFVSPCRRALALSYRQRRCD